MKNYFRNWDFMRVVRLAVGVFIMVQGYQESQWLIVGAGAFFSLMPLLNIGCCGSSACSIPAAHRAKK